MNTNKISMSVPSSITFNNCQINKPSDICDAFNRYFTAAGDWFDMVYSGYAFNSQPLPHEPSSTHNSVFTLQNFTFSNVKEALQSVDTTKSTGEDKLDPHLFWSYVLHLLLMKLLIFWTYPFLLGLSWRSGKLHVLSHCIKVVIKPHISKLPCLAKVLELLVNNQIKLFLSVYPVLRYSPVWFQS